MLLQRLHNDNIVVLSMYLFLFYYKCIYIYVNKFLSVLLDELMEIKECLYKKIT